MVESVSLTLDPAVTEGLIPLPGREGKIREEKGRKEGRKKGRKCGKEERKKVGEREGKEGKGRKGRVG